MTGEVLYASPLPLSRIAILAAAAVVAVVVVGPTQAVQVAGRVRYDVAYIDAGLG